MTRAALAKKMSSLTGEIPDPICYVGLLWTLSFLSALWQKTLFKLAGPALFGLASAWLLERHDLITLAYEKLGFIAPLICWLGVVLLVVSSLVLVLSLIPGESSILIDGDGLKITNLFYTRFYQWRDFDSIEIYAPPQVRDGYKAIAFNLIPEKRRPRNTFARYCCGFDGLIPDNFTVGTRQLYEILTIWKKRGLTASSI
jgi:hypothetical protein